jgi:predicted nucleotidyltransferase component of viral defense system
MSSSIENSLKDRVRVLAKDKGRTFNSVWTSLILERFLSRLARSPDREKLIFKGGMLLSYYLPLGRETTDLDFLINASSGASENVKKLINEIASIDLADGFTFELTHWNEIDHTQTPYPGFDGGLLATCGGTKTKFSLDIGIGDVVSPEQFTFPLSKLKSGPLFEAELSLLVYPPVTIFAEKLETACFRGVANSRMKDYHDLWILKESSLLSNRSELKLAIEKTFAHRGTSLGPIPWDDSGDYERQEQYWNSHLRGLEKAVDLNLPSTFAQVVREINEWLKKEILSVD